jgi:cell division septation protein DedD
MTSPPPVVRPVFWRAQAWRLLAGLATLALLDGCAGHHVQISATQEAAQYAAKARRDYTPPGPPGDPWAPYIIEAAAKYDVPELWIREVIRQESGGRLFEDGQLITSSAGAMGLMQVMPETYDGLRQRYSLGDDPFDPHDNIMAGTAYIREMYDVYGSPGFLAAYNAGPGRLEDYLIRNRPLPDETRHYVARIGPNIAGVYPLHPSQSTQFAMMQLPTDIPPGPRYPRRPTQAPVALAENRNRGWTRGEVQMAALPAPPVPPAAPAPQQVAFEAPRPQPHGLHLIPRAMADTLPLRAVGPVSGGWAIQVGAFGNPEQARAAAEAAKGHVRDMLAAARPVVGTVKQAHATLYRARLTGLSREAAVQACEKLAHHGACIVVSPDAQS